MEQNTIIVEVDWTDGNYSCGWGNPDAGVILLTGRDLDRLKEEFAETLSAHVQACVQDGDELPQWLKEGDYTIDYHLSAAALLQQAERYTTLAAISRACGINYKQLHHYASGLKKPRLAQRQRILDGLRLISNKVMALR